MKKNIKEVLLSIAFSMMFLFFLWRFIYWVRYPELTEMQIFLSLEGWQLFLVGLISSLLSLAIKED